MMHRCWRLLAATIAISFSLASAPWAQTTIYSNTFPGGANSDGWQALYSSTSDGLTVLYADMAGRGDDGGSIASCCIFWQDKNHQAPGIGQLAMLGFNTASRMGVASETGWLGATVRLRVIFKAGFTLPLYSKIYWWMQRTDPNNSGVNWNMGYAGTPIDRELGFDRAGSRPTTRVVQKTTDPVEIEFVLSPNWRDWVCYGGRADKPQYNCPKSPTEFLNGPMINMGFTLLTHDNYGVVDIRTPAFGSGEFTVSLVEITKP